MKSMFKTAVVGVVAAAFAASVGIASGLQAGDQQQQQRQRIGEGRRGGSGPGFGRGGAMRHIFTDLTEQQRQEIKAIHQAQRQSAQEPRADAKLRQQLELELLADVPNDQAIESLKQQIAAAQLEGLSRHIAVQKQIAQVLTAEQRASARERMAQGRVARGR